MIYLLMVFGLTQHNTYEWMLVQEHRSESSCVAASSRMATESLRQGVGFPYRIAYKCVIKEEGS